MKLHILGCYGPYPPANGATSGYLVENGKEKILLDCGCGVLGRLTALCDPASLSAVLLTHLHFDHMSDALVLQYFLQKAGKKLPLYVPIEDHSPVQQLFMPDYFDVTPYPETLRIGGFSVSSMPVIHPSPCRALRIQEGGKTLVYTGDTNDCPGLDDFSQNADALLADAAFLQEEWNAGRPHMSARGAAALARSAGAKKLYLTHLPLAHDPSALEQEAAEVFPGARAVKMGQTIEI